MLTELNDEQRLVQHSASQWLAENYPFQPRSSGLPLQGDAWGSFAEMGWLGLPVPEAMGGSGLGPLETGLMCEAFGRHLVREPYAFALVAVQRLFATMASEAQATQWLPGLADGSIRLAWAHHEPGELSPWHPRVATATRTGDGWVLDGAKIAAAAPGMLHAWLVSAVDERANPVVVLVPVDHPGLRRDSYASLEGSAASDMQFDAVQVPNEYVLCSGAEGLNGLHDAMAHGLTALCWQAAGTIAALVEQTATYTRDRKQFGKSLSEFQAVQHRLAEMKVQALEALACCELTSLRLERDGEDVPTLVQLAVLKVGNAANYVSKQAVQLHGAMGVCEELPVAAAFRWLQGFRSRAGFTSLASGETANALLTRQRFLHSAVLGASV